MKKLRYLFILLFSLTIISCGDDTDGGDDVTPVDPLDTQGNLLNGTWKVKDANSVTKDGTIVDVFTSMTLTVSGGSASGGNYSTLNSDSDEIWPSSGSWTFQNSDKNKILRSDGVSVSISLTETTLRTSFTTTGGIKDGNWVFDFVKQ
ncbi:MAG: lipocalin family protein [Cytophagales bacterium]